MNLTSAGVDLGIVVKDVEPMLHFYRDLLGLHYEGSNPVGDGMMHRLWAAESMIKIVAPEPRPTAPAAPGGLQGGLGLRYFTISIEGIEELVDTLAAAGVKVVRPVTQWQPGVKIAVVEDPEGNYVEFLER